MIEVHKVMQMLKKKYGKNSHLLACRVIPKCLCTVGLTKWAVRLTSLEEKIKIAKRSKG
jgi:hypothetical protein